MFPISKLHPVHQSLQELQTSTQSADLHLWGLQKLKSKQSWLLPEQG
jgi:hypothetical protein